MPDYKHRKIQLNPRQQHDETWRCPYCIIEFRPTCWGYLNGYPEGVFTSRQEATAAALKEAKRLIDTLEGAVPDPQAESVSILGTYASRMGRLLAWDR